MPVYTGFNLATQGRNGQPPNATQNYYTGLNRPNPIGNQLGNQSGPAGNTTAVSPRPTLANPNTPGSAPDYSTWDTRYLDRENARIRQANIDGRRSWAGEDASGFMPESEVTADTFKYNGDLDEDDPRVQEFRRLYGQRTFVDENGNPMQNQGSRGGAASGYRILTLPESGQIYHGLDNQEYLQDGSRIMRLPDGRIIVENANYNGGGVAGAQRAQETSSRQFTQRAARTAALMIAGGVAGGYLGGVEGFTGAGAEAGGVYGGMQGTAGGTFANWTPTLAEGAAGTTAAGAGGTTWSSASGLPPPASGVGPVAGSMGYEGAGAAATGAGGMTTGQMIQAGGSLIGTVANAIGNRQNANQYRNDINSAVERADTWGPENRQRAIDRIWQLYNDPSSIENTPGYQFARQQGEQGVNRAAAGRGYFRSPNMLYDLSKFNQGLATKTYDAEMGRLLTMAGAGNNPANAASLAAQGAGQYSSMNRASLTSALAAGGTFMDWLSGLNFG